MQIKVDTSSMQKHAQRLSEISESAFPAAVRHTLNDAAYDVKTNTMPFQSKKDFVNRQDNFFKANSSYDKAEGSNVSTMKSVIGFLEKGLKGQNNRAVKDLEEQEESGSIEKKSFIPMASARKSASVKSLVRPNARLSKIRNIIDPRNVGAGKGSAKQRFVKSVYFAGKGGFVMGDANGKKILWRVNSLKKTKGGSFKLTPLYSYKQNRSVKVKATHFMKEASLKTADNLDDMFLKHAEKQFKKIR